MRRPCAGNIAVSAGLERFMSQRLTTILVLGALVALGPFTIDMYLPALPALTTDLSTTSSAVQLTLTGTLLGLALGQLVIGPLSDSLGRRRPLLAGVLLHIAASIAIVFAADVVVLGVLRVLQGVGAAAGAVIALAIIRDLYSGRAAATMFSRLMLVMGASPVLAPTLGGELLRITSWRGVFVALTVYGVLVLVATTFALRESLPPQDRRTVGVASTLRVYGMLLKDRSFVGLIMVAGLIMAGLFGYIAGSSFVFQQQFGFNQQQFGLAFGVGAAFLIAATQLNASLLRYFESGVLLLAALIGGSVAGLALVATTTSGLGGSLGVLLPMFGVLFAIGLALPNAPALALARHGDVAGTAAALLGAVQFGVGALVSPLVGVLGNNAMAMGAVVAGGMVLALIVLVVVARPGRLAGDTAATPKPIDGALDADEASVLDRGVVDAI